MNNFIPFPIGRLLLGLLCCATIGLQAQNPCTNLSTNLIVVTSDESAAGLNDGTAAAYLSTGTLPQQYIWSTGATTQAVLNLAPGAYSVSVTLANGCVLSDTVTISAFTCTLGANLIEQPISCHAANDGLLFVSVNNASSGLNYQWSNGVTALAQFDLSPGTYTVTVNDSKNCPIVLTTTLTDPEPLRLQAYGVPLTAGAPESGMGIAQPSGGTPPYTYIWSDGTFVDTLTDLTPGLYQVTIQDMRFCEVSQTIAVNAATCALSNTLTVSRPTCFGFSDGQAVSVPEDGLGPFRYRWSSSDTTATAEGLAAGHYAVTLQDAGGCAVIDTFEVMNPFPVIAQTVSINNVECGNFSSGSAMFNFVQGNNLLSTVNWPPPDSNLLPLGNYTLNLIEPISECPVVVDFTINSNDVDAPIITCPANMSFCDYGPQILYDLPTVNDNCSLNNVTLEQTAGLPNFSFFPIGSTLMEFKATDASGNTATCSFTITLTLVPDFNVSIQRPTNGLNNGSINVTLTQGAAPFIFNWTKDQVPFSNEEDLTDLSPGAYQLEVTDVNGCTVLAAPYYLTNLVSTDPLDETDAAFRVWPNPTAEMIWIEVPTTTPPDALLELLDAYGRVVMRTHVRETTISMAHLPAGLYALRLSEKGMQRIRRVTKI
jgi:HYR domain